MERLRKGKSVCLRWGGLASEEGVFCHRMGGCRGGVVYLLLVRDDVCTLGPRVMGVWLGGSLGPGGGVGGCVVSVRRKTSKAASPPLMVRICVGPCGEGANCILHLVSGGRRPESLGSAYGAFCCRGGLYEGCEDSCVKADDRGDDKALCLLNLRLLEGAVFWVPLYYKFFHRSGALVVFHAARGASFKD